MNLGAKIILGSLRYHARGHLGSLFGVIAASAVLTGALAVGDCVRESLRRLALARIGKADFALAARERLFRAALAEELQREGERMAPILQAAATAANNDSSARANQAQVLGVESRFWNLAQSPPSFAGNPPSGVVLNEPLARQLGVHPGDTIVLHVQKVSALSLDSPIAPQQEIETGIRLQVSAVVSDNQFGRFSLRASQISPFNAFVPLPLLQSNLAANGQANLLLASGRLEASELSRDLRRHWQLADADLGLRKVPGGVELNSERIFLDAPSVEAAVGIAAGGKAELLLTYFANELRSGQHSTPYSMVTAAGPPWTPEELRDDEIVVNDWLAQDLQLQPGGEVSLSYLVPGLRGLEKKEDRFRLARIVRMEGPAGDRTLMPDFPGIANAEKTENWDAGFPIDLKKIRLKDEEYWRKFRGTPKAFVTLRAGQRMWANRFGAVTAVRYPAGSVTAAAVQRELTARLDPADLGLSFQPVRQQALEASAQSQDFGGLFLAFSFFLIAAALVLLALLFQLGLEKRANEIGILLAVGWRPRQVRRWLLAEGVALAVVGGLVGLAGGLLYARAILYGLSTVWRAAISGSALQFHVTPLTLLTGGASAAVVSALVIWLALRGQTRRPARELLEQGEEMEARSTAPSSGRRFAGILAWLSGIGALGLIGSAIGKHDSSAVEAFFGGGALLLIAGVSAAAVWFRSLANPRQSQPLTFFWLGVRGTARKPKRSLAVAALLASGSFLIIAVEANKLNANSDSLNRSSGTGGFALIGQSTLPITQDLNSRAGREFFGLDEQVFGSVSLVPMRVREGDDASCLNLNRAQSPRLLGVDAAGLQSRRAFTFTELAQKAYADKPWLMLTNSLARDEVPAIGDEASITWALGKKIGDSIGYTDEHGRNFKVRLVGALANSILQGNLIIDESRFLEKFPGSGGYRMFLIDAPSNQATATAAALSRALRDRGMEVTRATDRLSAFNAVQNTYLGTFQVLGGLGMLLGSAGLGAVVLRNVLERRGELAVMRASGFRSRALRRLIVSEHVILQVLGLMLGVGAAAVAVLPVWLSPGARLSLGSLGLTLAVVFLSGILWTWAAARAALSGELLEALRNQ